jgi:hypothetical protein
MLLIKIHYNIQQNYSILGYTNYMEAIKHFASTYILYNV